MSDSGFPNCVRYVMLDTHINYQGNGRDMGIICLYLDAVQLLVVCLQFDEFPTAYILQPCHNPIAICIDP